MASSSKALVSRLKPGFSAPPACLSLDPARLGIGSGLNKRDSASGQVLSGKSCHKPMVDTQARTTKTESDSFLLLYQELLNS
jgi:hypothetical protein